MKKIILAVFTAVVLCFAMTACGGGSDSAGPAVDSVAGSWECTDMTMAEGESKMVKEDLEKLFGAEVKELAKLTCYPDGNGELEFLGDTLPFAWEEGDGGYLITVKDETAEPMAAVLENDQLTLSMKDGTSEMIFVFTYLGRVSAVIDGWDLQLTDEETAAMSTHMAAGESVVADGILYGSFGGASYDEGTFSTAKIKGGDLPEIGDRTVIADSRAYSLKEHDGYIYGALNFEKIVKVKVGEAKAETIYEGACDYVQIANGKIYFSDGDYRLCSMDLDGKNVETVIDKKDMYYTYVLSNGMVLYQDDPDNESLHVYNLKTGEDSKINDEVSHSPVLCGDYLYYTNPVSDTEYTFNRINLYTGDKETAPGTMDNSEFFIDNGKITFCVAGLPTFSTDEWDGLEGSSYAGLVMEVRSSNGEYRVLSDSSAEMYLRSAAFDEDGGQTRIGY